MKRYICYALILSIVATSSVIGKVSQSYNRKAQKRNLRAMVQEQKKTKPATPPTLVMPSCEQQTYYYKQQAQQYYYYAQNYGHQINLILQALNTNNFANVSQKIQTLQQQAKKASADTPPPLPPRPGKMFITPELQKLLSVVDAENVQEAIETVQAYQDYVVQSFSATLKTAASALNSKKVSLLIQESERVDPLELAVPENINNINQAIVKAIYQLKAQYLDAASTLQWAQPNIMTLQRLIAAKQQKVSQQQLMQMIPNKEIQSQPMPQASQTEKLKALEALSFE